MDEIFNHLQQKLNNYGGMAEWLKAAVLKTVKGESSSRVRIPLPPHKSKGLDASALGPLLFIAWGGIKICHFLRVSA